MKVDAGKIVELVRKMKPLFADSSRVSQVKEKGTCDYVTQVDIQVQKLVKEGLYSMYPQVQFMGEEQDNSAIDRSGDFWILDPVDGTTNLIHDFRSDQILSPSNRSPLCSYCREKKQFNILIFNVFPNRRGRVISVTASPDSHHFLIKSVLSTKKQLCSRKKAKS